MIAGRGDSGAPRTDGRNRALPKRSAAATVETRAPPIVMTQLSSSRRPGSTVHAETVAYVLRTPLTPKLLVYMAVGTFRVRSPMAAMIGAVGQSPPASPGRVKHDKSRAVARRARPMPWRRTRVLIPSVVGSKRLTWLGEAD